MLYLSDISIDEHKACGGDLLKSAVDVMVDLFKGGLFFMKFLKLFSHYKISIIVMILVFFLAGFFITESLYNANQAKYIYTFTSEKEDVSLVVDSAFYDTVFKQIDENNKLAETDSNLKKISYAKIDYKSMLKTSKITKEEDRFEIQIQKKYFPSIVSSTTGKVNASENRIKNYFNLILSYTDYEATFQEVKLVGNVNPWMVGGISAGVSTLLLCLLIFCYSLFSKEMEVVEDNQTIFKSIFHKAYWKDSVGFINNVKKMCTISILFACMMLCKFIPIPSGFGSLGISFTYLFFGIICWIYGPICGLFIGFCSDILGYFINPGGIFFMGYTLDAMLAGFMYGLCFYKKRITFANCFIARAFVNLFINVGLGSLWWKIIYNLNWDAYLTYMSLTSLPKNILYLLPQSILLFILFKAISKPLASFGLIDQKVSDNIHLF